MMSQLELRPLSSQLSVPKDYLAHYDEVGRNQPQGQQPLGVITASEGEPGLSAYRVPP